MNFLSGTIEGNNFVAEGEEKVAFPLEKKVAESLKAYEGKRIIFGIRPEDIYVEGDVSVEHKSSPFEVACDVAELLGYERIIYGNVDKQKLTIKINAKYGVAIGEKKKYVYDVDKIHFFDPETTNAIK
ncbi:MAG: hypothetical protein MJ239_04175 [Bacilli bacterium]|nr:hypothetical protein [Bacilli bacterium]